MHRAFSARDVFFMADIIKHGRIHIRLGTADHIRYVHSNRIYYHHCAFNLGAGAFRGENHDHCVGSVCYCYDYFFCSIPHKHITAYDRKEGKNERHKTP